MYAQFNALLKAWGERYGIPPALMSSHGLRIAAATQMTAAAVPQPLIDRQGLWAQTSSAQLYQRQSLAEAAVVYTALTTEGLYGDADRQAALVGRAESEDTGFAGGDGVRATEASGQSDSKQPAGGGRRSAGSRADTGTSSASKSAQYL